MSPTITKQKKKKKRFEVSSAEFDAAMTVLILQLPKTKNPIGALSKRTRVRILLWMKDGLEVLSRSRWPHPDHGHQMDAGGDNKMEKDATSQLNKVSVRLVTTPRTSPLWGHMMLPDDRREMDTDGDT
ncbi:hypothetical protein LTR40_007977, partial [Exophiala xenobiotica]